MQKRTLIDVILLILLYVGISTFPVELIVLNDKLIYYIVEALLLTACLVFVFIYIRFHRYLIPENQKPYTRLLMLFIPTALVCFSNYIYALCLREPIVNNFEFYSIPQAVSLILVALLEEIIFRHILLGNLEHPNKIIRILISAGVFALCHFTHFFSTFNPYDLIIVVYTFFLGLILGFIYCYGRSLVMCVIFHLCFNIFNSFLFEGLFVVNNPLWYYLINGIVGLLIASYLVGLYYLRLRKSPARLDLN